MANPTPPPAPEPITADEKKKFQALMDNEARMARGERPKPLPGATTTTPPSGPPPTPAPVWGPPSDSPVLILDADGKIDTSEEANAERERSIIHRQDQPDLRPPSAEGISSTVPATGATAGTPGTWTPDGARAAASFTEMDTLTASPTTAWTAGQHVVLADNSHAFWNGTAWA